MWICRALPAGLVLAALSIAVPAQAFDPTPETDTPAEAFRFGYSAYLAGDMATAIDALGYAAEQGHTAAIWLMATMYADGQGVAADPARAFSLFSEIVTAHANDRRVSPDTPFVANAFVALGDFYRSGQAGRADPQAALQMYLHAGTYFNDPTAQFNLARMFYYGEAGTRDPGQAVQWANLSARAGNPQAQALLGFLLFQGEGVQREPMFGLAYLHVAWVRTGGTDPEIRRMHEAAFALATDTERRTAIQLATTWLNSNAPPASAPVPTDPPAAPPDTTARAQ